MKFHGEEQSVLGDWLIRFAAIGIFAYSTFNVVAGGLGVHSDLKNLLILATGGITIIQVWYLPTVQKFRNFSVTQILRENNFKSTSSAILTHLDALNSNQYLKAEIDQNYKIQSNQDGKIGSFDFT